MSGIDFLDSLKEYIEQLPYTPTTVSIGTYKENGQSVAIRPTPTTIVDRYQDQGKVYPFGFQILVHMRDNMEAYRVIENIRSALGDLTGESILTKNGSYDLISMECTTTPNYVQKTNQGSLWTAIFTSDIYIRR